MKDLFDPDLEGTDSYVALRDLPRNEGLRSLLKQWWNRYEPYADRNFPSYFANEVPQRFWEMYLGVGLLNLGCKLLEREKRGDEGPDFCILRQDGKPIWIEAVAPTGGDSTKGKTADCVTPLSNKRVFRVPEEQIILRLCSGMKEKKEKYEAYLDKGIVQDSEPCVIALNTGGLPRPITSNEIPYALQAVFSIGRPQVIVNSETFETVDQHYATKKYISKANGSSVPTMAFLGDEYRGISGLLFSDARIERYSRQPETELAYAHNPMATVPLSLGWLASVSEWWWENPEVLYRRIPLDGS